MMPNKTNKFQFKNIKLFALCRVAALPLLLFACFLPVTRGAEKSFKSLIEEDLDGDGKPERIELDSRRANTLSVRRGGKLLWQGVPSRWQPWKLAVADVDGDRRREIILGVFKATKFFPVPHNCLFVYDWTGERAQPKWLGSSLSRAFVDFAFAGLDGEAGDELIALERTLERKKSLAVYRWNGFGFTLDHRRGDWSEARISGAQQGRILIEADGERIFLVKDKTR
jgi:hypothetical protein